MKAPFSLFLALRYLKPKRTFVSVITLISILGVTFGVTVLILVLSVMTGFEMELRGKVLGFEPHVLVQNRDAGVQDWQKLMGEITKVPKVVAAAPYVLGPVVAEFGGMQMTPFLRGIDAAKEQAVTDIARFIQPGGSLELTGDQTVVGAGLAEELGLRVGDKMTIYSPGNLKGVLEAIKKAEKDPNALKEVKELVLPRELTVTGIFKSGRYDYDARFMLVPLHVGQELYGMSEGDMVTGISVKTVDANRAGEVKQALQKGTLPPGVFARTWEDLNRTFFEAIAMERNVMFFLLLFIIVVAAFGIMSTLITVTVQKTREIGIMKALGATTEQIVWVFLGQGMVVGFFGNLSGLALGMTLIAFRNEFKDWLAETLHVEVFPASIYQFSKIPAQVVPHDVAVICISAFVICSLAALIPAYFAARLDPVKALRQE